MRSLFESNMSKFLSKNMYDKEFKRACQALLKRGYDIARIPDSVIKRMNPMDAFRLKGKKGDAYFKFWFVGNHFAFCTWANTMIDDLFRWKKTERGTCIGDQKYVLAYIASNDAINQMTDCYVVAYDDMPQVGNMQTSRKAAKSGATALLTNDQIRKMNLDKYRKKLAETGFSNGSELGFVKRGMNLLNTKIIKFFEPCIIVSVGMRRIFEQYGSMFTSVAQYLRYANYCNYDISQADPSEVKYLQRRIANDLKTIETSLDTYIDNNPDTKKIDDFIAEVSVNAKGFDMFVAAAQQLVQEQDRNGFVAAANNIKEFVNGGQLTEINNIMKKVPFASQSIDEAGAMFELLGLYIQAMEYVFRQMRMFQDSWTLYKNKKLVDGNRIQFVDLITVKKYLGLIKTYNKALKALL